jgi:cytochrome c biogenesis protein CcmG/thiol:disulfide interchange protein DsbE
LKQNSERALVICHSGGMRRAVWILAATALVAVLVIGLTQAGGNGPGQAAKAPRFDLPAARAHLATAPRPLAALYAEADQLLGGGRAAFDRRIAALRGHPVVVNKWASWCRPCRAEFPIFQQVAATRGTTVAFVGLNGKDKAAAAERVLTANPLPYPSFQDPSEDVARALEAPSFYPMTVFLDRRGHTAHIRTGEYTSARELTTDIDRYLR